MNFFEAYFLIHDGSQPLIIKQKGNIPCSIFKEPCKTKACTLNKWVAKICVQSVAKYQAEGVSFLLGGHVSKANSIIIAERHCYVRKPEAAASVKTQLK